MPDQNERVIALSHTKLALTIAGSLLFVAAGAWFLFASNDGSLVTSLRRFVPPLFVHALGVAALFFGAAGVAWGIAKSRDKKPGLILNAEGMTDNSSAVAAGFIPWSEVTGVDTFQVSNQRMLVIRVTDPTKYIERGGAVKRSLNRANANMCGSPIVISSNALRIPFDELRREVVAYAARYAPRPEHAGGAMLVDP